MEENFEKPKKKFLPIIIIAAILVILIVGGIAIYNLLLTNPKNIIGGVIDKGFAMLETKENIQTEKSSIALSIDVDTDDVALKNILEVYKINTAKITLNTEMDINQEYLKENIVAEYDGDELINAGVILQDENMYLYAEDLFSKYIEISSEYIEKETGIENPLKTIFENMNKISATENNKLLNEIKDTIKEFLKEKEATKENVKIEIDDEDVSVQKSTIELTEKECTSLLLDIVKTLKESQYFISLYPETELDIEENLDEVIEDLERMKDNSSKDMSMEISVYTKGLMNKLVRAEIILIYDDAEECYGVSYTIESNEKSVIAISGNEDSKSTSKMKDIASIDITKEDNTITYKLKVDGYSELKASVELTEKSKTEGTAKINLAIPSELSDYQFDDIKVSIVCDYSRETGANISKENVKNNVKIEELSEADATELYENLQNSKLYELIQEIIPANDDYDYDYDSYNYDSYNYDNYNYDNYNYDDNYYNYDYDYDDYNYNYDYNYDYSYDDTL